LIINRDLNVGEPDDGVATTASSPFASPVTVIMPPPSMLTSSVIRNSPAIGAASNSVRSAPSA